MDVNLHVSEEGDYIEIVIDPQPNPVNYKGEYHYRSGSTKQELRGTALDKFILEKYGKRWDSVVIPNVRVADLKQESIDFFIDRGISSKRLDSKCKTESTTKLLENLKLTEDGKLKRAAILLFHPDPEKYVTGAYIKIGFFKSVADLIFQDEIHGNLFEQVEKALELILTKYTKAIVSYEGIHRVETYEYPEEAIREALLNAVSHKIYMSCTPIQIKVYPDKIRIWNDGKLPENWTIDNLSAEHSSKPYNPDIANAFFKSGYVESWGRGISKIEENCINAGLPKPLIENKGSDFTVIFKKDIYNEIDLKAKGLNERQVKAVLYVKEKGRITNREYININNHISDRTALRDLDYLVSIEILKRIGNNKASYYEFIK